MWRHLPVATKRTCYLAHAVELWGQACRPFHKWTWKRSICVVLQALFTQSTGLPSCRLSLIRDAVSASKRYRHQFLQHLPSVWKWRDWENGRNRLESNPAGVKRQRVVLSAVGGCSRWRNAFRTLVVMHCHEHHTAWRVFQVSTTVMYG